MPAPKALLLINTGTPDQPEPRAIRRFLAEFLSDPRVVDLPALGRWLLLHWIILPRRPARIAPKYQSIWTSQGSPLLLTSQAQAQGLQERLGQGWSVHLAMRYGNPALSQVLQALQREQPERLVVLPLFPQYASATTGSALQAVMEELINWQNIPPLEFLPSFYQAPGFIQAWVQRIGAERRLADSRLVFSFHGLPLRQVRAADIQGKHCLQSPDCCHSYQEHQPQCYPAQCRETARLIAQGLGLGPKDYEVCFQSRLGKDPWLEPATSETLAHLAKTGVERVTLVSPAFVADCLETLEELALAGREVFLAAGGKDLELIGSLNAQPDWLDFLAQWVLASEASLTP